MTCVVAASQHSSNQRVRSRKPESVSFTFTLSSILHCELCVKLVDPMNAVFYPTPNRTLAWWPPYSCIRGARLSAIG